MRKRNRLKHGGTEGTEKRDFYRGDAEDAEDAEVGGRGIFLWGIGRLRFCGGAYFRGRIRGLNHGGHREHREELLPQMGHGLL
jgi:hypothetical protein